jgi:hypothetical protein
MKFETTTTEQRKLNVDWSAIEAYVSRWRPGTRLAIEIKRIESKNSDALRSYYYAVVLPILCETLGYDPEEHEMVHRQLKIVYFGIKADKHGVYREKEIPSVFSKNSDQEVGAKMRFIDWVCRKSAEHGGYVPAPNERPQNN